MPILQENIANFAVIIGFITIHLASRFFYWKKST